MTELLLTIVNNQWGLIIFQYFKMLNFVLLKFCIYIVYRNVCTTQIFFKIHKFYLNYFWNVRLQNSQYFGFYFFLRVEKMVCN